jgi:membrane protein YqaA with SNARE-associated domain
MLTAAWGLFVPIFASASLFSLPSILMCLVISWRCTKGKLDVHVAWIRVCAELASGFTSPSLWLFPNLIAAFYANQFEQSKKRYCLMN